MFIIILVHHLPASLFLFIMFLLVVFHGMMPLFGGKDCVAGHSEFDVYVYISMRV